MAKRAESVEELAAWDTYLAAALLIAKADVVTSPPSTYYERLSAKAAEIADEMIKERRLRNPK